MEARLSSGLRPATEDELEGVEVEAPRRVGGAGRIEDELWLRTAGLAWALAKRSLIVF